MKTQTLDKLAAIMRDSRIAFTDTYEGIHASIEVNEPATDHEIQEANKHFGYRIPADYISFLRHFNGAVFFKVEDIGGFQFLGCSQLIRLNQFQKENLEEDWNDEIILFCSCLGDGDYIGFKVENGKSYSILDCFAEEVPSRWRSFGKSFDDFLENLIDSKGEKFWL